MSFDQGYADALEEIAELKSEVARLHALLTEHGVEDPARARLSKEQRHRLAEADRRDARVLFGPRGEVA